MRNKIFKIAAGSLAILACGIGVILTSYRFISDLAASPILISLANTFEGTSGLAHDIESTFPAEAVIIIRYDYHRYLNVTIVNSIANQLTVEEQKTKAAEIARIVWKNNRFFYMARNIRITFVERTTFLGIPCSSKISFGFNRVDLLQK